MTSGKFITHLNLTLLGHIDLGHLHNAGGQVVADGDGKFAAGLFGVHLLVLADEIHDKTLNQRVGMLITRPVVTLDTVKLKVAQHGLSKLAALGDDLGIGIVVNPLGSLTVRKLHEFLHENILQVVNLRLKLFRDLG